MRRPFWLFLLSVGCVAPSDDDQEDLPPNVLFILLDDIGLDKVNVYAANPSPPPTPTIDQLAADGVLFRNAYADPFCSATRAGLLTGLHALDTGIGNWLLGDEAHLPYETITIPEALDDDMPGVYSTAAIGKWHVAEVEGTNLAEYAPLYSGFASYKGGLNNVGGRPLTDGGWESWTHYAKSTDGFLSIEGQYLTQAETDDAIAAIDDMSEPWFTYLAYHAAHEPWVPPPPELNFAGVTTSSTNAEIMDAMVTSVDFEIGRLLDTIDPDVLAHTTVIVMGDNGTDPRVESGADAGLPAKGTVTQRGIRVPLVIVGPQVRQPGAECDALVQHTDVFATVLELMGSHAPVPKSSLSFAPLIAFPSTGGPRDMVYTEVYSPDGLNGVPLDRWDRAVTDGHYKLIRTFAGDALYDLATDPGETTDLALAPDLPADVLAAYHALDTRLVETTADAPLVLP